MAPEKISYPEPVLVVPDGDEVRLSCRSCPVTRRVSLEPTSVLLATIDEFVAAHALCDDGRPDPTGITQ